MGQFLSCCNPNRLRRTGARVQQRGEQLGALPQHQPLQPGSLSNFGGNAEQSVNESLQQVHNAHQALAQRVSTGGSNLVVVGDRAERNDQDIAESFRRIERDPEPGPSVPRGGGGPGPASTQSRVNQRINSLTDEAWADRTPLMQGVHDALQTRDERGGYRYVNHDRAEDNLRFSALLHNRTDELYGMVNEHGPDAVAEGLRQRFGRPMMETQQLDDLRNLSEPERRQAFDGWAHGLWGTVEMYPHLADQPDTLASHVFDHEKGYNRSFDYVHEAANAGTLAGTLTERQRFLNQPDMRPAEIYQALRTHGHLPAEADWAGVQQAVRGQWGTIGPAVGMARPEDLLTDEFRDNLDTMGLL